MSSINVTDMVGRHVANQHGAEFRVISVRYDLRDDRFKVWLAACDEFGDDSGEEECGLATLRLWELL